MSLKWISGTFETILPDRAEELLASVVPDKQRRLYPGHVQQLSLIIESGQFLSGHIVIAIVGKGGPAAREERIANGHHTLRAIARSGRGVRCIVETYMCDTESDYRLLFSCYDTENKKRSNLDVAQSFLMTGGIESPDVSPSLLSIIKSGVDYASRRGDLKTRKMVTKFDKFTESAAFAPQIAFIKELDGKKEVATCLYRAPVAAAIVVTHSKWPTHAKSFWEQVVSGFFEAGSDDSSPAVRLNRWLKQNTQNSSGTAGKYEDEGGNVRRKRSVGQNDVYTACIRCWNAHARGEKLSRIIALRRGEDTTFNAPAKDGVQCQLAIA